MFFIVIPEYVVHEKEWTEVLRSIFLAYFIACPSRTELNDKELDLCKSLFYAHTCTHAHTDFTILQQ